MFNCLDSYGTEADHGTSSTNLHHHSSKGRYEPHYHSNTHGSSNHNRGANRSRHHSFKQMSDECQMLDIRQQSNSEKEEKSLLQLKDISDEFTWKVCVKDFKGFKVEEFSLTIEDRILLIKGNHEESKGKNSIKINIERVILLPKEVHPNNVIACLCANGSILIRAPKRYSSQ